MNGNGQRASYPSLDFQSIAAEALIDESEPTVSDRDALGLPWMIDEDDFDFIEEDEDPDDLEADALLDDEDDDDDDEDDPRSELPPAMGRRAMAARARAGMSASGSEAYGSGYGAGYVQALRDLGVNDAVISESYGGLFSLIGKGVRGVGTLAGAGLKGALGGKSLTQVAEETGTGVRESVLTSERLGPVGVGKKAPAGAVEADGESLPPTYVEDETGFSEDLENQQDDVGDEIQFGLVAEDRFGQSCKYGYVDRQSRRAARDAALRSVQTGTKRLESTTRSTPKPFVEDPGARPLLFSDGAVWDPVYGTLSVMPCPSCTRLRPEKAKYGASASCVVCEGYGAVLVPERDVDSFVSTPSYGFLPLLVALVKATETSTPGTSNPQIRDWMTRKKAERVEDDSIEDDDGDRDVDAEYGIVRTLVPSGWWKRHGGSR